MTTRSIFRSAMMAVAILVCGCTADVGRDQPTGEATDLMYRGHPLVGRIWKPSESRFATEAELNSAVSGARFALLGEKHDNPEHHRIQALIVDRIRSAGRSPALVFEMLTQGQQPAIDAFLATGPDNAAGLGAAVGWEKSGWPDWPMYQPIFESALKAGAPVLAGGLDRDVIRSIASDGADVLGAEEVRALGLDQPIPEPMRSEMREEIYLSHCKQLPDQMLDPMVTVTLAKDTVMAAHLIKAAAMPGRDSAVLIAGNGHTRSDRGVPWHLGKQAPGSLIITVGIIEVVSGRDDPEAYSEADGGTALPYDFVWFTPRLDDEDPCEVYAEQLRKARERRQRSEAEGQN